MISHPPDKDVWIEAGGVLEADGSQGVWESMVSDPDFDPNTICTVSITDPDCVATSVPTAYATPPCPNIAAVITLFIVNLWNGVINTSVINVLLILFKIKPLDAIERPCSCCCCLVIEASTLSCELLFSLPLKLVNDFTST